MKEILEELKLNKIIGIEALDGLYLLIDAEEKNLALKYNLGNYKDGSREILISDINLIEQYFTEVNPLIYDLVEYSEKPMLLILPYSKKIAKEWYDEVEKVGVREEKDVTLNKILFQYRKAVVKVKIDTEPADVKFLKIAYESPETAIIALDPSGRVSVIRK